MRTSDQIDQIAEALAKAQSIMENPEKNKTATIPTKAGGKYSYNYADLPALFNCARRALSFNGIAHSMGLQYEQASVKLIGRLMHVSGQWIESEFELPRNSDPKLMAANITYGRRYIFSALVGIAADDDTDSVPESAESTYTNKPVIQPKAPPQWTFGQAEKEQLQKVCSKAGVNGPQALEIARLLVKRPIRGMNDLIEQEFLRLLQEIAVMSTNTEFEKAYQECLNDPQMVK